MQQLMKKSNLSTIIGLILTLTQFIIVFFVLYFMCTTKLFPTKIYLILSLLSLAFTALCIRLMFLKKPALHIGLSIINVLILGIAIYGIHLLLTFHNTLDNIQPPETATKNILVVVRADDPAINLQQLKDYRIGIQKNANRTESEEMLNNIKQKAEVEQISTLEYDTIQAQAQALLNNETDAILYADTFSEVLEESIPGYSTQIKILDQTEIQSDTENQTDTRDITQPFHIYISGIDTAGSISKESRSDVNIIMSIDPQNHKVLLTSTPRDYYIPIPGISGEQPDKLTHAGLYGIEYSKATLEQLYNIKIDGYVRVNFTSLIKIVDTLGGIEVNSEYAFQTNDYEFKKGLNIMNGKKALAFSRERKSFEGGDRQRGKNQQAVITAMIQKAASPNILLNANTLLNQISDSVQTDLTADELATLIQLQLNDLKGWTIESQSADGSSDMQPCFSYGSQPLSILWPDETSVATASENMRTVVGH